MFTIPLPPLPTIIACLLFITFTILLSIYIWLSFKEILVTLRNYNYQRAKNCNPNSCGLYFHNDDDPESKDCLNPLITKGYFKKISKTGQHTGCRYSMLVREVSIERAPATKYKEEYMVTYESFHISKLWWRIILLLAGSIMWLAGVVTTYQLVDLFIVQ